MTSSMFVVLLIYCTCIFASRKASSCKCSSEAVWASGQQSAGQCVYVCCLSEMDILQEMDLEALGAKA